MPFTLAHPAAILIFPRKRYVHFPALVLGSMSPDFIYYLCGKPTAGGHTLFASEWLNLPLCFLLYGLYRFCLANPLKANLPTRFAADYPNDTPKTPLIWLVVFSYSAWLGMASHILLDSFTHKSGYFVQTFPILETVFIFPIFKWVQYAGGIFGLIIIICYQYVMARRYPYFSQRTINQKARFWCGILFVSLCILIFWQYLSPRQWFDYVVHIIRFINVFILTLAVYGIVFRKTDHHA